MDELEKARFRLLYKYKLPPEYTFSPVAKYIVLGVTVFFIVELFTKE